jgi:hypothetical protein
MVGELLDRAALEQQLIGRRSLRWHNQATGAPPIGHPA